MEVPGVPKKVWTFLELTQERQKKVNNSINPFKSVVFKIKSVHSTLVNSNTNNIYLWVLSG